MRALVNWRKIIQKRIESGDIEVCPSCGKMSAYYLGYVDKRHGIAHISTASCFEWQCGHCHAYIVEKDSPINAECYTHIPRDEDNG